MKKIIRRHILLLVSATAMLTAAKAAAQINTEVEIRYEETPTLRELNKLTLTPTMTLPKISGGSLAYSTRNPSITLPGTISTLDPAGYADTLYSSPYRGYAALGFMPRFNLGASAGYKICNTDRTRLNAYLQYDGTSYKPKSYQKTISQNTATLGAALHQALGRESFLDAGIDYTHSGYNFYQRLANSDTDQSINRLNLSALWSASSAKDNYGIGIGYRYFNYGYNYGGSPSPHENNLRANAFFSRNLSSTSKIRARADFSYLTTPLLSRADNAYSRSVLGLGVNYLFDYRKIRFDIGLKAELAMTGGFKAHIAPNLQATWSPDKPFKLYLKATGGMRDNSLSTLYESSRFSPCFLAYDYSNIPLDTEIGITLGSWHGLWAQASFSYAKANDWLLPVGQAYGRMVYQSFDLNGFKVRAEAGYRYRDIGELSASWEMAPKNDATHAYYLWLDRSKTVVGASLTIHPITALDINIDWQLRTGRRMRYGTLTESVDMPLGNINSLSAGALYRITPQWSVLLRGENLTGHQYDLIGFIPGQGRTGLAGVTYKF